MVRKGAKMRLGFYVDRTTEDELNSKIYNLLNEAVENNNISDGCVFYNEVDFSPSKKKFGTFNSTDIWFFSGTLVVTALSLLPLAKNVVNKIKLVFLYDKATMNRGNTGELLDLLSLSDNIKVVSKDEESEKEFYRLTGKTAPPLTEFSAEQFLKV
jgi:hypothetical protein